MPCAVLSMVLTVGNSKVNGWSFMTRLCVALPVSRSNVYSHRCKPLHDKSIVSVLYPDKT